MRFEGNELVVLRREIRSVCFERHEKFKDEACLMCPFSRVEDDFGRDVDFICIPQRRIDLPEAPKDWSVKSCGSWEMTFGLDNTQD